MQQRSKKLSNNFIENLHIKNFRQFKTLNVSFNKGFNFIAGPNGCGKTSILAGISHSFDHSGFQYSRLDDESEVWVDLTFNNEKKRVGIGSNSIQYNGYRQSSIKAWESPQHEVGRESVTMYDVKNKLKGFCPLFIGAHRSIKYQRISGMQRELTQIEQISQRLSSGAQSLYGDDKTNIKQWFVNRYFMIDKDWAVEERVNWEHMINNLPELGPFNSNFTYIKTGKDLEPVFSIYGKECYLEELSSGFQAVLSIIANIFEWIEGTQFEGERIAMNAEGTVLIDELDLHLHPEWQFTLRDGLVKIFPKIQFIVTTHSPHLLSSAKENEVIIMTKNDFEDEYLLKPSEKRFSGWSTDQILSEIMGVKSLENKDYEKLINDAFVQIELKSIGGLKQSIGHLKLICHPNDTILTVLNTRLASMVAVSND